MADEGITPLASASEPDMPLSRHPAPQSPDPLAWIAPYARSLERPPFTAPTCVSSLPLGCLRRQWACPLLLATRSFEMSVPTSAYLGRYPQPWLLGESLLRCHTVGTCSCERPAEVTSFLRLVLRVRRVLLSAGVHGGEPGSRSDCPAPALVRFGPSQYSSARWSFVTTVLPEVRCLPIDACFQG